MKNNKITHKNTDIEGNFLQDTSLWTVIGNELVVNRLKVLLTSYLNDKSEGRGPNIQPIVFHGSKGTGRTVLAHAYAYSMGASQVFVENGATINMGGADISAFLSQGDQFASYLIFNSEHLTPYPKHILFNSIKNKKLITYELWDRSNRKEEPFHRLIMFNTSDISKLGEEITKRAVVCSLQGYSNSQLLQILKQRTCYLNWQLESEEVLENIVRVCNGSVSLAISILGWSYKTTRSKGKYVISTKDLNDAFHFLQ